jgi:hypothetical protein
MWNPDLKNKQTQKGIDWREEDNQQVGEGKEQVMGVLHQHMGKQGWKHAWVHTPVLPKKLPKNPTEHYKKGGGGRRRKRRWIWSKYITYML